MKVCVYNLSVSCTFLDALASLVIFKDPNSASIGRIPILFLIRLYPWVCSYTILLYPIVSDVYRYYTISLYPIVQYRLYLGFSFAGCGFRVGPPAIGPVNCVQDVSRSGDM